MLFKMCNITRLLRLLGFFKILTEFLIIKGCYRRRTLVSLTGDGREGLDLSLMDEPVVVIYKVNIMSIDSTLLTVKFLIL
jgi:hypothetical protein